MIAAVLLTPSPKWQKRLLDDGPCGARLPRATQYDLRPDGHPWWVFGYDDDPEEMSSGFGFEHALVLARHCKPVRMGLAHASWLLEGMPGWKPSDDLDYYSPWDCDDLDSVLYRAQRFERAGMGRITYLDGDGRKVQGPPSLAYP